MSDFAPLDYYGLQGYLDSNPKINIPAQQTFSGLTNASLPTGSNAGNGLLGYFGAGAAAMQGLAGLANAYLGLKNYKLAKKMFRFEKGLANRNLANQAKLINNTYDSSAAVAAGMIGSGGIDSKTGIGYYGMTDPEVAKRIAEGVKDKYVDGSKI